MVYVQSFWSKPFLNVDSNEYNYRVSGGFLDKRYFYYCWALSFLSLKNFREKVILVTDDLGKYLLVEALGMDYNEVRLEFNTLDNLSSSYWAIPKLHVYKSMKEPFLHIDGDLILYPGFKDLDLENRELIFEFKNESFSVDHLKSIKYLNSLLFGEKDLTISYTGEQFVGIANPGEAYQAKLCPIGKFPGEVNPNTASNKKSFQTDICDLNCGVIGGTDYVFFNEFAAYSLDLFNENLDKLDSESLQFNKNLINSYFEQYLLYQFICQKGKAFSCIYENNPREFYQRDFFLPVNNSSRIMTHFILNLKVKYSLEIELNIRINYPEWHARINDLINRNII